MTIPELYQLFLKHPSVQTDTRKLKEGDLFFALKGDLFNGNTFAAKALEAGAAYAIIDDPAFQLPDRTILVDNVLLCLQQLALHHRRQFRIPVLAITGSNGKTTTKELIHEVLSSTYKTYTTLGNLNNHIGIPLTLLRIQQDAEMAVIEMGANHQKEISSYCTYTEPTHGLITNLGKAHLEGFGGVEGVRKGKGELFDYLRAREGTAFVYWDDEHLRRMSLGIETIIRYGTREGDLTGRAVAAPSAQQEFLQVELTRGAALETISTQLVGDYNTPNVLAAVAVGKCFGVPEEAIKKAIESYLPENSRSQLIHRNGLHIILDAYNANPSSMRAAIENFRQLKVPAKVLLLGAMAELGEESLEEHQAIIDLIAASDWKYVVLVGGDFGKLKHPYIQLNNSLEAHEWLLNQSLEDAYLLIKGSRSMQMEKVL
ncbi:UDP-N-acetylmuramoyl-tripeptide--D-alanyl-D-alanine ligase [Flavihumibacter sp. CACIAM 22H1]|uniref:UDP-N-acetylmuramoyl-tripeptide--D-alanyl-D- alanine ligase n=1 Tax=Flavihumibacter sp. CACIAM 22H1 TaxID=1812911 RepID=UPI0007A82246|nr:UDP-N-acetylmuramoyl-tripeptide--D-alanyl-D-alanine ligase [Flavihumibacter sp. CACIAM 22H1]KYP16570.1 MAG: UDP-N-acetylmuramoylalanyl-D-glutamate--2,6-diaminopimelate ligase [Flavihumibacter sp. CACIAM 22H1]